MTNEVKRNPVDFRYDAINPDFLKCMAQIGAYAAEKYGSWEQYRDGRLEGEKSPVNHIYEHLRCYALGEAHDRFGGVQWHLVAIAYNAMMEFFYCLKWGHKPHPLALDPPQNGYEHIDLTKSDPPPASTEELPVAIFGGAEKRIF